MPYNLPEYLFTKKQESTFEHKSEHSFNATLDLTHLSKGDIWVHPIWAIGTEEQLITQLANNKLYHADLFILDDFHAQQLYATCIKQEKFIYRSSIDTLVYHPSQVGIRHQQVEELVCNTASSPETFKKWLAQYPSGTPLSIKLENQSVDELSYFCKEVQSMSLIDCFNTEIKTLPESLTRLTIIFCSELEKLPEKLPESLTHLTIKNCFNLKELFEAPPNLLHLEIEECSSLENFFDTLPKSLASLKIVDCYSLKKCQTDSLLD